MSIVDYIFILIIFILIGILISLYKKINYISTILEEVFQGNFNQRIRHQNHMKPLKILVIKINQIIERLQKINEDNKRSEESRKKMISNISHDLRTPLTSMLGYLELIFEDRNIEDGNVLTEKKKEEYLKVVYNKGNYLYDLMEEFFQVSKLDSNDMRLEIKKVNISEIVRENVISFLVKYKSLIYSLK